MRLITKKKNLLFLGALERRGQIFRIIYPLLLLPYVLYKYIHTEYNTSPPPVVTLRMYCTCTYIILHMYIHYITYVHTLYYICTSRWKRGEETLMSFFFFFLEGKGRGKVGPPPSSHETWKQKHQNNQKKAMLCGAWRGVVFFFAAFLPPVIHRSRPF